APFDPAGVDTMDKPCYDFKSLSGSMGYLRTLLGYLERLGWEPYASDHEDANAQFELNWKYADALTTPDRLTFFKMMTSHVDRPGPPGAWGPSPPTSQRRSRGCPARAATPTSRCGTASGGRTSSSIPPTAAVSACPRSATSSWPGPSLTRARWPRWWRRP